MYVFKYKYTVGNDFGNVKKFGNILTYFECGGMLY